jgi:hypothetical protein
MFNDINDWRKPMATDSLIEDTNPHRRFPQPVKLSPAEATTLRTVLNKKQAVQTWVQMCAAQGEQRIHDLMAEEQKTMIAIAKSNGLDLKSTLYVFDPMSDQLVPKQTNFA